MNGDSQRIGMQGEHTYRWGVGSRFLAYVILLAGLAGGLTPFFEALGILPAPASLPQLQMFLRFAYSHREGYLLGPLIGIYLATYATLPCTTLTAQGGIRATTMFSPFGTVEIRGGDIAGRKWQRSSNRYNFKGGFKVICAKDGRRILIDNALATDGYFDNWYQSLPDLDARPIDRTDGGADP